MLVDPPALRAGFLLPAGDGALIEVEGDDNSLHRTAVGKQRHDCEHQPPRLVHPVEGGVFGLGEGPPTAFAAITALFVAMDHEVALSRTTVGAAAPVVTELLVRVHADTHPLFGGQRPNKDAAGPAFSSTQPSSTLPWGATRLIALLRNPVDRAYSHYQMEVRRGKEARSFEDATQEEMASVEGEGNTVDVPHAYLRRGLYAEQLERFSYFANRERLLVIKSENLFTRRLEVLERVLRFLGLPPFESTLAPPMGRATYEPMDPLTRRRLEGFFAPHNERLYDLLNTNFGW